MSRHAYLIMAHNEFNLLKKLITLLDDPRNDIYVHVDKKAKDFDPGQFQNLTQYAQLSLIKRKPITWEGYSVTDCIFRLIEEAVKTHHNYYHLLSGMDLPIKSQDFIHDFFENHGDLEYIEFDQRAIETKNFYNRIKYYHFFQEKIGKQREGFYFFLKRLTLKTQEILRVDRTRKYPYAFKKGATWFSITHAFANYLLERQASIRDAYKFTLCADEIFLQTAAWNSHFRDNICENYLRYIDWKRGKPYVFKADDFEELINSDALWARKFSEEKDPEIVDRIVRHINNFASTPSER